MQYLSELERKLHGIQADARNALRLVELAAAGDKPATPQHELDHDLPAYLVFLILANIKKLGQVSPDHILVKAVRDAVIKADQGNPGQSEMFD